METNPWDNHSGGIGMHHQHQHQQEHNGNGSNTMSASSSSSSLPPSLANPGMEDLDRQLVRQLMNKYTLEGLARLIQEENQSAMSHADTASVLTTSTYSSVRSDDAPSLFDSASSVHTASDASSARGSIISNMSARTAKLLGRKSSSSHTAVTSGMAGSSRSSSSNVHQQLDHRQSTETLPDDDAASVLTTNSAKQKGTFMCGFCREEGIRKTCTRKNDLKRHMEDFHSMNALWFCGQNGCGMVFDWPTVYKTHLKTAHGGSRVVPEDVKVTLCPQTVFACGFDRCIQVFESSSDADAPATFKEYVAHVVKHFDDGGGGGGSGQPQWSYSTRLRNLLRQSAVLNAWADTYPDADSRDLRWQPQTTGVLRKLLETRHVLPRNVGLLVRYAYALGSDQPDPSTLSDIHQVFRIPVSEECQLQIPGHRTMRQPSPMIHQQHQQQQQQHTPQHEHQQHQQHQQHQHQQQQMMRHQAPQTPQQPEQDQFSFKISRGNNPHPHLAHYYATQRRTFQTKPPVRAGRSARPPMLSQHQQNFPQQSQPQLPPQQAMFNPNNMGHGHGMWQQQQQQPYRQMMTLSDKGIIADDLRSLRSMASTSSGGSNGNAHQNQHHVDVDMADAHMMDLTAYNISRISAATAYSVDVGLQSPASEGDCVKMEGRPRGGGDLCFE